MSCDSWEEAMFPTSPSSTTSTSSPKPPQQQLPPELVVSEANVGADSGGLLVRLRGGLAILFVVAVWVLAVSSKRYDRDGYRTTIDSDTT